MKLRNNLIATGLLIGSVVILASCSKSSSTSGVTASSTMSDACATEYVDLHGFEVPEPDTKIEYGNKHYSLWGAVEGRDLPKGCWEYIQNRDECWEGYVDIHKEVGDSFVAIDQTQEPITKANYGKLHYELHGATENRRFGGDCSNIWNASAAPVVVEEEVVVPVVVVVEEEAAAPAEEEAAEEEAAEEEEVALTCAEAGAPWSDCSVGDTQYANLYIWHIAWGGSNGYTMYEHDATLAYGAVMDHSSTSMMGNVNQANILSADPTAPAALFCSQLTNDLSSSWWMPTDSQLRTMGMKGLLSTTKTYWSSKQSGVGETTAITIHYSGGSITSASSWTSTTGVAKTEAHSVVCSVQWGLS